MASNRTISVNTSEHDVLLTARKNHPAVFVDGMFLDGVERVEFTNHYLEKCEVVLTFNDRVETNPFPLNDITLLEKLFVSVFLGSIKFFAKDD
ncbi:Uncharacterised protein [Streptococcus pneumoniae]|nr:Uncharacterised protein [Streptococcus pneumoniae]